MFRLSEALYGSVLKTNDPMPRVLLKFVKRSGGRKVLTLDVELLARVLQTKTDQRTVVRIPGELCITPVMKGKKSFGSVSWTRVDIVGECTAHEMFPLTRMEFLQLQHHLDAMRATVAKYEEGLAKTQQAAGADPPAVLREADTEAFRSLRRNMKKKNIGHDETGPSCEMLMLEPYTQPFELQSPAAPENPAEAPQMTLESPKDPASSSDYDSVGDIPASKPEYVPQTLDLID